MGDTKITINRTLVGVLALGCLLAAVAIWIGAPDDKQWTMWCAAFTRVGLLMSAFWIALPYGNRDAAWANVTPWTFLGIILSVVGVAARPRVAIPILIVLAVVGFVLRPRPKKRPESH
jgi:uncharacterized membrane protein